MTGYYRVGDKGLDDDHHCAACGQLISRAEICSNCGTTNPRAASILSGTEPRTWPVIRGALSDRPPKALGKSLEANLVDDEDRSG